MPKKEDPIIRFWRKVQKTDGCWFWTAQVNNKGYGKFFPAHEKPVYAHRYSWELTYGSIPPGMQALHRCDTPHCVRPDHLFLGTQQDNVDDMDAKGRRVTHPKITGTTQAEIVARYFRGTVTQRSLAAQYGISRQRVSQLVQAERSPRQAPEGRAAA